MCKVNRSWYAAAALVVAVTLYTVPLARAAAVVRKADDSAVTGSLVAVEDGHLVVATRSAEGREERVRIPLIDIVEVSFDGTSAGGPSAPTASTGTGVPPDGPGLTARYFNQQYWKGSNPLRPGEAAPGPIVVGEPDLVRVVPHLNHAWGQAAPDPGAQQTDNFSVAFSGKVRTREAGSYTFLGFSDDDHYLFVNGQLVSSDPGLHTARDPRKGGKPDSVKPLTLAANTEYDLLFLMNENVGEATAIVRWVTPGQSVPTTVPQENLKTRSGPPAAPKSLRVVRTAGDAVTLAVEDAATNEVRFVVERATDAGFTADLAQLPRLGINATTFTDKGLTAGQQYHYRVRAQNFEGESAPATAAVTAGAPAQPPGAAAGHEHEPAAPTAPAKKEGAEEKKEEPKKGEQEGADARSPSPPYAGERVGVRGFRADVTVRQVAGNRTDGARPDGTASTSSAGRAKPLTPALSPAYGGEGEEGVAPAVILRAFSALASAPVHGLAVSSALVAAPAPSAAPPAAPQPPATQPAATQPAGVPGADAEGFVPLFNGRDLTGWEGDPKAWSVRDGAITGEWTEPAPDGANTFLIFKGGEFKDFELRFKYRIPRGNSGMNYRSKVRGPHNVGGYQADIEAGPVNSGILWDQADYAGKRGTIGPRGQKVTWTAEGGRQGQSLPMNTQQIQAAIKPGDWNDYVIVARGNHLIHKINGNVTTEVIDQHPNAMLGAGVLAIQLEMYMQTSVQFKDIRIKTFDGTPVTAITVPTVPAGPAQWTLRLGGGDQLTGELLGWDEKGIRLKTAVGELTVPLNAVREAWKGSAELVRMARASGMKPVAEDVAYVERESAETPAGSPGQIVPVQGVARGTEGNSLTFRYREQDRRIALDRLVGLAFGGHEGEPADESFHQTVQLASGDSISGTWVGVNGEAVQLKTKWGQELSIPNARVKSVRFKNGRLVYLSDLTPAKVEQVPYFDRVVPYRVDQGLKGGPLKLSDGEYARGIAVHSHTTLHYDVGGRFERFRAKVGFQQPDGKLGRAAIRVLGDGKVLWENPDARGDQPPADIDVSTAGVRRLSLQVDFGEGEDVGDRVIWAMPRVLRAAAPPPTPPAAR